MKPFVTFEAGYRELCFACAVKEIITEGTHFDAIVNIPDNSGKYDQPFTCDKCGREIYCPDD